jgi:hypothetical protein
MTDMIHIKDLLRYSHIAVPMSDLAPQYVHPESGQTLKEIAKRLSSVSLLPRPDIEL